MRVFADVRDLDPTQGSAGLEALEELADRLGVSVEQGRPEAERGRPGAEQDRTEAEQDRPGAGSTDAAIVLDGEGLVLVGMGMELRGDFSRLLPRLRAGRLGGELLVKAARIKGVRDGLTAIDATAGMGEDACLLAAAGFSVTMYERDPVVAALLRDALARASAVPDLAPVVARMELREQDSIAALSSLTDAVDVVVLDPMFPERTKSASVKKKAQLLQMLQRPCADECELLGAAVAAHPRKIVVKRPVKGPYLAGMKPSYSIEGKAVRYDCIALPPR